MTKKKCFFLYNVCLATVFFRVWRRYVKMKLLKLKKKKKKVHFTYAVRESQLDKTLFSDPEETKICLAENLKLTLIMSLKYKYSPLCLDLQSWVNSKTSNQKEKRKGGKPFKIECVNLAILTDKFNCNA